MINANTITNEMIKSLNAHDKVNDPYREVGMDQPQYNTREKVNYLEDLMKEQPQLDLKVNHYFSLGLYGRELFIPKGTLLTGHIHKYPQMNIMLKGIMSVLVNEEIKMVYAPFIVCSPAGTKRIAYAHEDTIWLTIHATNETDVNKIEEHFIAKSEQEFIDFVNEQKKLPLFEYSYRE